MDINNNPVTEPAEINAESADVEQSVSASSETGANSLEASEISAAGSAADAGSAPPDKIPEKKRNKKSLIIIIAAVLLLLALGLGWFFMMGPGAKRYTVSFDTDGGDYVESLVVLSGRSVLLPDCYKEGYIHLGWTQDGTSVPEEFEPESDVTLKAVWEAEEHALSFLNNECEPYETKLIFRTDEPIAFPTEPVWPSHTFVGWFSDEEQLIEGTLMPPYDFSVTSHWVENSYKIIFDTNGGSKLDPLILIEGDPFKPGTTERENYTFDHWEDPEGNTVKEGDVLPAEDTILHAVWKRNTFKVSFDSKGGSSVPSITVNAGDKLKLPANPTKSGFDFVCWQDKNATPIYDNALLDPKDITLYAVWKEIEVTSISLNYYNMSLNLGETTTLKVTFNPSDAADKTLTWKSTDPDKVSVSSEGLITAKAKGSSTITATTSNGKVASCNIYVVNKATSISLSANNKYLTPVSADVVITASVSPSDADLTTVKWVTEGDVDTYGAGLAMKIEEGNKITFKIANRGRNQGGKFKVYAQLSDGSISSETITITVEPQLTISASGSEIISQSVSEDKLTYQFFIKSGLSTTGLRANMDVDWTYSTSNGVINSPYETSDTLYFTAANVGSGSHYQGAQIKAKSPYGQVVTIVINPQE